MGDLEFQGAKADKVLLGMVGLKVLLGMVDSQEVQGHLDPQDRREPQALKVSYYTTKRARILHFHY